MSVVPAVETYPYWCGRLAASLRHLVEHPDVETAVRLSRECLTEYDAAVLAGMHEVNDLCR
jgi:hypothetical protein